MYNQDFSNINPYINDLSCNHITVEQLQTGSARIVSIPAGAKIFIDYIGDTGLITPATVPNISVGVHAYKLTYPGYNDIDGLLFININETYELTISMERVLGYFDPTQLVLYTLTASLLMVYFSQRRLEKYVERQEYIERQEKEIKTKEKIKAKEKREKKKKYEVHKEIKDRRREVTA